MQISEYCTADEINFTMNMGENYEAKFDSLEELDEAIIKFEQDCHAFVKIHGNMCSSIIERACFPDNNPIIDFDKYME